MEFPRKEYWSELPFPSPGGLPGLGIEPMSPALAGGFFTTEPPGKPNVVYSRLMYAVLSALQIPPHLIFIFISQEEGTL